MHKRKNPHNPIFHSVFMHTPTHNNNIVSIWSPFVSKRFNSALYNIQSIKLLSNKNIGTRHKTFSINWFYDKEKKNNIIKWTNTPFSGYWYTLTLERRIDFGNCIYQWNGYRCECFEKPGLPGIICAEKCKAIAVFSPFLLTAFLQSCVHFELILFEFPQKSSH